jgi:hypothetical protein
MRRATARAPQRRASVGGLSRSGITRCFDGSGEWRRRQRAAPQSIETGLTCGDSFRGNPRDRTTGRGLQCDFLNVLPGSEGSHLRAMFPEAALAQPPRSLGILTWDRRMSMELSRARRRKFRSRAGRAVSNRQRNTSARNGAHAHQNGVLQRDRRAREMPPRRCGASVRPRRRSRGRVNAAHRSERQDPIGFPDAMAGRFSAGGDGFRAVARLVRCADRVVNPAVPLPVALRASP